MSPAIGSLMIPAPGGSTSTMVTIAPSGGFTGSVSLGCTVAFQGPGTAVDLPSCSLSPAQLNLTASTNTTLTISTTAPSLSRLSPTGTGLSSLATSALALLSLVIAAGRTTVALGSLDAAARDAARQASIALTPAAAQAAGLTVVVVSCEPAARAIGDLATSRIDDQRVLSMFGLNQARNIRALRASWRPG